MNEYGLSPIAGVVGAVKVKNALKKIDPDLVLDIKNVRINGQLQGCSGFVTDPATGNVVYLNTDCNHGTSLGEAYYRTAEHTKDYTGGRNRFTSYRELPQDVVNLLREGR